MTQATLVLYETDFALWVEQTAQLLKAGQFSDLDLVHLIEEVEDLSGRERDALYSNLKVILLHLLKWDFQSHKRTNSWKASLREHRQRIKRQVKKSPSLQAYPEVVLGECYLEASELAADETGLSLETFPPECPYAIAQILDPEFLPD